MSALRYLLPLLLLSFPAWAAQDRLDIAGRWSLTQEMSSEWTVDGLETMVTSWETVATSIPNKGFTSDAYWMRLDIRPDELAGGYWRLWIRRSLLADIQFYLLEDGKLIQQQREGLGGVSSNLHMGGRYPSMQFAVQPHHAYRIYLRLISITPWQVPTDLVSESFFITEKSRIDLALGFFLGILLAFTLYSLVVFFISRDIGFLLYVGHGFGLLLYVASWKGIVAAHMGQDWLAFHQWSVTLGIFLVVGFSVWISSNFLELEEKSGSWHILFSQFRNIAFVACVLTPFVPFRWSVIFASLFPIVAVFLVASALFAHVLVRQRPMRLFAFGWLVYMVGTLTAAANRVGWFPFSVVAENILLGCSVFYMVLLSIAQSDRFSDKKMAMLQRGSELHDSLAFKLKELNGNINQERTHRAELDSAISIQQDHARQLSNKLRDRYAERQVLQQRLDAAASIDGQTGLRNEQFFLQSLARELEYCEQFGMQLSVLLVDVDRLGVINDTYGQLVGDECVKQIADILNQRLRRPTDVVGRISGGTFAVLMPDTSANGAMVVAENIRQRVATCPMLCGGLRVMTTVSIGIGEVTPKKGALSPWVMLEAEKALRQAKADGRNCVELAV